MAPDRENGSSGFRLLVTDDLHVLPPDRSADIVADGTMAPIPREKRKAVGCFIDKNCPSKRIGNGKAYSKIFGLFLQYIKA